MSRVAGKIGMARETLRQRSSAVKRAVSSANVAAARACVRLHWPIPCGVPRPTLRRCARRVPKARGHSPWRGTQRRERTILPQPLRDKALRAVCFVRLLAKGMAIRFVVFRASHPAKPLSRPLSRPCGTFSEVPEYVIEADTVSCLAHFGKDESLLASVLN